MTAGSAAVSPTGRLDAAPAALAAAVVPAGGRLGVELAVILVIMNNF